MLPELSIERIFRREIDALPLPPEQSWIPDERRRHSLFVTVAVAAATLVLVASAIALAGDAGNAGAARQRVTFVPVPLAAQPACQLGRCTPYRSNVGYYLDLPFGWRLQDHTSASSTPFLVDRAEFTALSPNDFAAAVARYGFAPGDLVVSVYERRGISALDWARNDGCGAAPCQVMQTVVGGLPAYAASWPISPSLSMHAYYVERGERMLIATYVTESVPGVTAMFGQAQIVLSIGFD
jgi:hypothetical protein